MKVRRVEIIGFMKRCTKCRELKPMTEAFFCKRNNNRTGLAPTCKLCSNSYQRRHRTLPVVLARTQEVNKAYQTAVREETLKRYGVNGRIECVCCGEKDDRFISLDHINGVLDKSIPRSGFPLFLYLRANGFPSGYQDLCFNCNIAKGIYGECPHKALKISLEVA